MVKLDLDINEIVGLAEMGKIDDKKLKKFLKSATKEELEDYILSTVSPQEEETENDESLDEESEDDDEEDIDDELDG